MSVNIFLRRLPVFLRTSQPSIQLLLPKSYIPKQNIPTLYRTYANMTGKDQGKHNNKDSEHKHMDKKHAEAADEAHQFQSGATTHRKEDEWKHRAPYKVHGDDEKFDTKWKGQCHCGKVKYELSRDKPLASKFCHCSTCQKLHGAPFQWAAIFHKEDINFTHGVHDLGWYDPTNKDQTHHLPCKISCAYCRAPIMDEGRNMILLFPPLIEGIQEKKAKEAFKPTCHMFYPQRLADFTGDGITKFAGLDNQSNVLDDDGTVLVEYEEGMDQKAMEEKKRKTLAEGKFPETERKEKERKQ